jgi:YebC/PmpR family DNA-binding regulatory protein
MGRFPNIAASKAKTGAAKAKMYSSYAKEIYQVAKNGGTDPSGNLDLRRLIEKAKKDQVTSDVINRAIEKAKGSTGEDYQTIIYEGFGPGASTLIIKTLTDNVNRTVAEVRAAFNKVHKSLGVTNSVSYNYDNLTIVSFKSEKEEEIFNSLIEQGIDFTDFEVEDGMITISVNPNLQHKLKDVIESIIPNVSYEYDETGYYPKDKVVLTGDDLEQFQKLMKILDDVEDVTNIYHNVNLD